MTLTIDIDGDKLSNGIILNDVKDESEQLRRIEELFYSGMRTVELKYCKDRKPKE